MFPDGQKLPQDLLAERLVLGSIMLDHASHLEIFNLVQPEDFILESHRRIYGVMKSMDAAGEHIDQVTVARQLEDLKHLQAVGGLSYLISFDEGLPHLPSIDAYVEIIREKSAQRKIIVLAQHLMQRSLAQDSDAAALVSLAEQMLVDVNYRVDETAETMQPGEVVEHEGGLDKFLFPTIGVETPWRDFTLMTGGYRRGELFIVAGNPSMGKSALAMQIAMKVAQSGLGVAVFSLEMSRASLVKRMACCHARVDGAKLRAGYLSNEERARLRNAIQEISDWPIWIAEHGISTVPAIRAGIRKLKAKRDIFMAVVDYLQLLASSGKQTNRNAEVSEITRQLKLMAVDEKVNMQVLSQLNRDNMKERRPPELRDLRESGSIEQDADATAFVWRPEMLFREREDLQGRAELILAKQRNGPVGKIELVWLGRLTKFESQAEDFREDVQ
jgi:replicative DNA helicase